MNELDRASLAKRVREQDQKELQTEMYILLVDTNEKLGGVTRFLWGNGRFGFCAKMSLAMLVLAVITILSLSEHLWTWLTRIKQAIP